MAKKKLKLRKCYVLREVPVKMQDLREGEIFRLEPASNKDRANVDGGQWSMVTSKNGPFISKNGSPGVECVDVILVRQEKPRFA